MATANRQNKPMTAPNSLSESFRMKTVSFPKYDKAGCHLCDSLRKKLV